MERKYLISAYVMCMIQGVFEMSQTRFRVQRFVLCVLHTIWDIRWRRAIDHVKLQAESIAPHKRRARNLVSFPYCQDKITTFVETGPERLRRSQFGICIIFHPLPLAPLGGVHGCAGFCHLMFRACAWFLAPAFRSHTRYKPWPRVEKFLSELEPCSFVADAGCGNGKAPSTE